MKYFTPDMILRYGSDDDAVWTAAGEEWERQQEEYLAHLKKIGPQLPRGMRSLLRRYYLHDARICTMAVGEGLLFVITLRLDGEGNGWLQLTYRLVNAPTIHPHPEIAERLAPLEWLYDEVDLLESEPRTFQHNILLTDGSELELRFRGFTVKRFHKLVSPGAQQRSEDSTLERELLAS